MSKARFQLPDLLKGIAVLLMIQVHLTELFATESFYYSFPAKVSLFLGGVPAAPLFMVVMGFFVGFMNSKTSLILLRGLKLIVWGLMLNIGLNMHLFYKIFTGTFQLDPLPYLFGVDILFLAGISMIAIALVKKLSYGYALPFIMLAFIIPVLSEILPLNNGNSLTMRYVMAYIHSSSWWSYFPALPWLGYPMIGTAAGIHYRKHPEQIVKICGKPYTFITVIIITLIFIGYGFGISSTLPLYYHHGIAFFSWAMMFLAFIVLGNSYLLKFVGKDNNIIRYLTWTGRNVTAFYVFQWLLIGNLATSLFKTQSEISLPVWFAGITVLSTIFVWLWGKRSLFIEIFTDKNLE